MSKKEDLRIESESDFSDWRAKFNEENSRLLSQTKDHLKTLISLFYFCLFLALIGTLGTCLVCATSERFIVTGLASLVFLWSISTAYTVSTTLILLLKNIETLIAKCSFCCRPSNETPASSPKSVETSASKVSNSPVKDSNSPVKDSNSPVKDSNSPVKDSNSPVKDSNSPVKDSNSPVKDSNSPVKVGSETSDGYKTPSIQSACDEGDTDNDPSAADESASDNLPMIEVSSAKSVRDEQRDASSENGETGGCLVNGNVVSDHENAATVDDQVVESVATTEPSDCVTQSNDLVLSASELSESPEKSTGDGKSAEEDQALVKSS